ncbi:DNA replication licensing factor MCM7 [Astathelohania contejeani]|uniref:DNA replication licensing factor MCM7 n=1 Tax=Astathelohania contejeani TaxID=164912 RepID=A0ABQ7I160_9MICR|nr:DNA replication licensing factor MCM7 [Thelohania contejeani]
MNELSTFQTAINYNEDIEKISKFLLFYTENETPKYIDQLKCIQSDPDATLYIDMDDLATHDLSLCERFENNTISYLRLMHRVVDSMILEEDDAIMQDDEFFYHRISRMREKHPGTQITEMIPAQLLRSYTIFLRPRSDPRSVRSIGAEDIGKLIRVRGIVTRVGQIRPSMAVATYVCDSCGSETFQPISGDTFSPLEECQSEKCKLRKIRGSLCLQTRGSRFIKSQSIRLQEIPSDVPYGCIPRSINIECYGTATDKVRPGDCVIIGGIFLPKPYLGYKRVKAGLLTDTFLYASFVDGIQTKNIHSVNPVTRDPNVLANAIAPEIYGMEDIKKILLLMLVGSPTITRKDGMRVRGDINVLLLGDPGIAKSQLLKTVARLSSRGIYTTGRGSSGVGLTASVLRDSVTGETVLEGGALVLADGGICCIDELDKMSEVDRTSIHEVMEQQSVSISKAGINTTLNARCGVLGAANPVRGFYDDKRSVEANVGLPCALLSRFDVLVVLRDLGNEEKDKQLGDHVASLHGVGNENEQKECIKYDDIKQIIVEAKKINPVVPIALREKLTNAYVEIRKDNRLITPRYLLSLIRLSIAHCRIRGSNILSEEDINEALRLMALAKVERSAPEPKLLPKYAIYNLIVELSKLSPVISLDSIYRVTDGKYSREDVTNCITEFESIGIWMVDGDNLRVMN